MNTYLIAFLIVVTVILYPISLIRVYKYFNSNKKK